MKWLVVAGVVVAVGVLVVLSCCRGRGAGVNVVGSTSIQPFAEMLSQEFNGEQPDCPVEVQGGGSTAGLQAAANGLAEIGMCSRALRPEEAGVFRAVTIARDGLAIVVHPSNPVSGLSVEQAKMIFAGLVSGWNEVGGRDAPIRLISREEGSGTREAFVKMVMGKARISRKALTQESNGAVKELVKHDPCAIGYMSLGLVGGELKALPVAGAAPTAEDVRLGKYPLVRPFLFVTKGPPTPRAQRFIDFVLSPRAQAMLETEGLVAAK
jgi:phosphate transport system substrate-binding protein